MSKEIKKITAFIADKEKERKESQADAANNVTEMIEAKTALEGMIECARTPEEYKKLLADIRDTEATIEFCKKKKMQADNAKYLTPEEYKEIKETLQGIFKEMQAEYKQKLDAVIDNLIALQAELENSAGQINDLLSRADNLAGGKTMPLDPMSFFTPAFDPINIHNPFYKAFAEKRKIEFLYKDKLGGNK